MDDGLALDEVELQVGRSPIAVGLALALIVGVGVLVSMALGGSSPDEMEPIAGDPSSSEAVTTSEQMALDHSDGIALEVVGDELWILGNGFGDVAVSEPFSIYVTGPAGELLRTIDVGRHFDAMGQSESYVWLIADGTKEEVVERAPEVLQISKDTGEFEHKLFTNLYGSVLSAAFSDSELWSTMGDGQGRHWDTSRDWVVSESSINSADILLRHDDLTYFASGQMMGRADDYGRSAIAPLAGGLTPVDMVFSGETLWILEETGLISTVALDFQTVQRGRCVGATHLVATPANGGVIASAGFDYCLIDLDSAVHTTLDTSPWPVTDTAFFAGQLWFATSYEVDQISIPIEVVNSDDSVVLSERDHVSTAEQMFFDRADGITSEVVGDELWILGWASDSAGFDGPFNIYVTDSVGRLVRTIDLGRQFVGMVQSESYVWLISGGATALNRSEIARISKSSGDIERFARSVITGWAYVFDDEGAWFERRIDVSDGSISSQLVRWDATSPMETRAIRFSDLFVDERQPVLGAMVADQDSLILGTTDGWVYRVSSDGEILDELQLSSAESPVIDLLADDELLWVLQDDGEIRALGPDLELIQEWGCEGAVHLVDLPGASVLASFGGAYCQVGVDAPRETTIIPDWSRSFGPATFFADRLWFTNSYLDTNISEQLDYWIWYEPGPLVTGGEAETTREQMIIDQSDGIALEVVGDELWILGGGSDEGTYWPFNIYVTGPDGELLRKINLEHRFDVMGQSDSYVWLISYGASSEPPEADGELVRISKSSGDMLSRSQNFMPLSVVAFTDDGFLWEFAAGGGGVQLVLWDIQSNAMSTVVNLPEQYLAWDSPVIGSIMVDQGNIYFGTVDGWSYRVSLDGENLRGEQLQGLESPVLDLVRNDGLLWALQENGMVMTVRADFEMNRVRRCVGATHLAALPSGGVVATSGLDICVVQIDGPSTIARLAPGQWPVSDSAVYAGQLWIATSYDADSISHPLEYEVVAG